MTVQKGKVISITFSLRSDGRDQMIADRSQEPLEFLVGKRKFLLGLDKQLLGLKVGDKKNVTIEPENGYGLRDETQVISLKRSQITRNENLFKGMTVTRKTKSGKLLKGIVKSFDSQTVIVDLNHPLAGETLYFNSEIVKIRDATKDEIESRA